MKRAFTWTMTAALAIGGATLVGCDSHDHASNLPPGENGTRAGGNGAFGGDTVQPGEGTHGMNGTGTNGNQLDMNGIH
jgi:hypothetical protein